jgi:uncharacterized protein (DUF4415 family)
MRKTYDFSKAKRNPYVKRLKKPVTLRIDADTLEYFKSLSTEADIPYQKLINLYLRECAENHKKPSVKWTAA